MQTPSSDLADTAAFTERIRQAATDRQPLRLRGGGSKDFYGNPCDAPVLDTRGWRGIVNYEPSELVVSVRCGTPLAELEAALAAQGQCLPFEPPHFGASGQATVGGMVAAGLSGPARASAGSVRDHVLGVTLLNGRAETLQFGGQVIKNVAGYDLSRLLAGSLGCLGLLLDISLKVMPMAPAEATLVWPLTQARALAQLHKWGAQPLPLNASCWVQEPDGAASLYLRLRGAQAAVEAACTKLLAELPGGLRMDQAQAEADWILCRDQRLPFFTAAPDPQAALWRLSVAQTAPVFELPYAQFIEWHGAQRWLWAPLSQGPRLREIAARHGGHATLFRAPDGQSAERFAPLSAPLARIHRQLKAEFDPAGIFNPGRLYPAL